MRIIVRNGRAEVDPGYDRNAVEAVYCDRREGVMAIALYNQLQSVGFPKSLTEFEMYADQLSRTDIDLIVVARSIP